VSELSERAEFSVQSVGAVACGAVQEADRRTGIYWRAYRQDVIIRHIYASKRWTFKCRRLIDRRTLRLTTAAVVNVIRIKNLDFDLNLGNLTRTRKLQKYLAICRSMNITEAFLDST